MGPFGEHFGGSPTPISRGGSPPDLFGNLYPCTYALLFSIVDIKKLQDFAVSGAQFLIPKFLIRLLDCNQCGFMEGSC